ncbi:restriction endonuclease subunit S [Clostridium formicaceticum]|uniref:EcoKI restriction-modification system protein HsdS n=1 Tax=Clostridium formicaceticum TaxID=1497 RepID=A0AAC9RPW3_9CLOT|nr:restriction endonuclease subunit S [Clostridium formicaceticum]AOY74702.1 hypothetical protein BJL90_01270 [Clostridium formicaceticum]ARE89080.1 EcoKI restriction-modification system protein HsdS [Clostridium formicaceticum]
MENVNILPYGALNGSDWTVNSLIVAMKINQSSRIPLSELCYINNTPITKVRLDSDKQYPYLEIKSIDVDKKMISNFETIQYGELPSRAKLIAYPGDIVLSIIRPERGAVAIVPDDFKEYIVTNAIAVLTPKHISPELLYFLLYHQTILDEFGGLARGAAIPTLSLRQLKVYQLPISKIPQKDEVARRMYGEWRNINKTSKEFIEIIEEVFQSFLLNQDDIGQETLEKKHMICEYEHLKDRLDASYHLGRHKTLVPWNCEIRELGEFIEYRNVPEVPYSNEFFHQEIPSIRIQNLVEDAIEINLEGIDHLSCEATSEHGRNQYIRENDIIIPKHGGSVRRSNLAGKSLQGAIVNQHLYVVKISQQLLPEYLVMYLKTKWVQDQISINLGGTVQSIIKRKNIDELRIPMPSLEIQRQIIEEAHKRNDINRYIDLKKKEIMDFVEELYSRY